MHDFIEKLFVTRIQLAQYRYLLIISALFLLVACGPAVEQAPVEEPDADVADGVPPLAEPTEEVLEGNPIEESYPPPTNVQAVEEAYPAENLPEPASTPVPDVYPPPAGDEIFQEPRFRLDVPIRAGSTVISGQAPPGMVLAILDVTYNGALLGVGPSDDEGRFSFNVQDLVEGNRVGITFGELEPGMTIPDMSVKYYPHRGGGFMNLP